jgi:hypothetical protein
MTEFTAEWIKQWRFLNTPIKDTFCISALIFSEALDEIERLQKENKELKEFVDATRPTGICEICTSNVISRYEPLQARVQELEQERRWIPVSERLPEDSRIYDVAIAGYEYSWTGTCVFGKWIGESGKAILGVTHWKYRPQPPKEV